MSGDGGLRAGASSGPASGDKTFQVDLTALVDLLGNHLYSGPQVYVRELLQNAVDAITARRLIEPEIAGAVQVRTGAGFVEVSDNGVGLDADQIVDLLATIGRTSKRDELGLQREGFLGQFGIGLLSAFMVSEAIVVTTQGGDGTTTRWVGRSDGSYTLAPAREPRPEPGTTVRLTGRPGAEEWLTPDRVAALARHYGGILDVEVVVDGTRIDRPPPWQDDPMRAAYLLEYAQDELGFTPFAVIDLDVPELGLRGVAFVPPGAAAGAARPRHRVYLRRMLLSDSLVGLVPDWAFFATCLVDVERLHPTASRESLVDDEALLLARARIGERIKEWLLRLSRSDHAQLRRFLNIHGLALRAVALHDDEMLDLVAAWVDFETTQGRLTLDEIGTRGPVRYCTTTEEFQQVRGAAAAQGILLVNAGYVYDADIVRRLQARRPGFDAERFDASSLASMFHHVGADRDPRVRAALEEARRALDAVDVDVVLRWFDPASTSALYLVSAESRRADDLRAARASADGLWAAVLSELDSGRGEGRPQLVLNYASDVVRSLLATSDPTLVRAGTEALYGQALLQARVPLRADDLDLIDAALGTLLERAQSGVGGNGP